MCGGQDLGSAFLGQHSYDSKRYNNGKYQV